MSFLKPIAACGILSIGIGLIYRIEEARFLEESANKANQMAQKTIQAASAQALVNEREKNSDSIFIPAVIGTTCGLLGGTFGFTLQNGAANFEKEIISIGTCGIAGMCVGTVIGALGIFFSKVS